MEFPFLNVITLIYLVHLCTCLQFPNYRLHPGQGILHITLTGHLIFRYSGDEAPVLRVSSQTAE